MAVAKCSTVACDDGFACTAEFICTAGGCDRGFEPNADGECVAVNNACIRLVRTGLTVHPPAGLRVLFRASDCDGNPIRALGEGDVNVINLITGQPFGQAVRAAGFHRPQHHQVGLFSVLSLDMSGSVFEQNAQGAVFDAAESLCGPC